MKKIYYFVFSLLFSISILAFVPFVKISNVNAVFTGDMLNNVIYLTFEDGDDSWINEIPDYYTKDVTTIMDNSYNESTSSVNAFYKTMSFNKLNLTSNFYTNNAKAFKVPYTKNELLPYSLNNPSGYMQYEVCTYSGGSEPGWLSSSYLFSTTHQFSCYDCGNSSFSGNGYYCDMNTSDGIGCLCAYVDFASSNPKTAIYEHVESYIREQIALQTVLKQITNLYGNIDCNSDGYIDALTFIFPDAENVDWSDLLWPHQSETITFSDYFGSMSSGVFLSMIEGRGVRNETAESVSCLLNSIKINNKKAKSYNLYLFSHLLKDYSCLKGNDNKEIAIVFTLAHELGHVLGLPDYYAYESNFDDFYDEDAVDVWDLMSYAIESGPTYFATYNREILGFTNSNNVKTITKSGTYTLKPTCYDEMNNNNNNSNNVLAYILEDPSYPNQKIYIEYRYKGGIFEPNYKSKENGLIIYRVDNNIELDGYGDMLSTGNFAGYPFNMYVFRENGNYYPDAFNDSNNSFGNSNTNSTTNAITFQTYDTSKQQDELIKSDITFHNTGIVIDNISINTATNEISFNISGGHLTDPGIDLSAISLIGQTTINHEVKTPYTDLGIDFAGFNSSEFNVVLLQNTVNVNVLGTYNYIYEITYKETNEKIVLNRTINVVDTTKPTVTLNGNAEITLYNLSAYVEYGVNYSDNYDINSNLELTITGPYLYDVLNQIYQVSYKVVDSSGNETIIYRLIYVEGTDLSKIKLIGESTVTHEVNTSYTDLGVDFSTFNKNDFTINKNDNLKLNVLGTYNYNYYIIYNPTGEDITLTRTVRVVDTTAPTITLTGGEILEIYKSQFASFVDPGYNFSDNYDTSLITQVSQQQISDTELKITYYAEDSSGNKTTKTRTVRIVPKPLNKTENNIVIAIKNLETVFYPNATIELEVRFTLNGDNLISEDEVVIKYYVNNQEVTQGITGKTAKIKFVNSGIYNLKITVGDAVITKQIVISDPYKRTAEDDMKALYSIIVIAGIIVVTVILVLIIKSSAKKIRERLDRY